jgi:hypothetical protein
MLRAAAFGLAMTVLLQLPGFADPGTDEYYPAEEAAERNSIVWPRLVELHAGEAVLEWPDKTSKVLGVGDHYREWELVAVISQAAPLAVLEQDFPRWGILAWDGQQEVVELRGPWNHVTISVGN